MQGQKKIGETNEIHLSVRVKALGVLVQYLVIWKLCFFLGQMSHLTTQTTI